MSAMFLTLAALNLGIGLLPRISFDTERVYFDALPEVDHVISGDNLINCCGARCSQMRPSMREGRRSPSAAHARFTRSGC